MSVATHFRLEPMTESGRVGGRSQNPFRSLKRLRTPVKTELCGDLERSIREQAASSSPFLRKGRAMSSPDMQVSPEKQKNQSEDNSALTFNNFKRYMDSEVTCRIQGLEEVVANNAESAFKRFEEHSGEIEYLKTVVRDVNFNSKESEERIIRTVEDRLKKKIPHMRARRSSGKFDRERKYLWSRRLLRLWPIMGSTDKELWRSTGEFIHNILFVSDEDVTQEMIKVVRRTSSKTKGKAK